VEAMPGSVSGGTAEDTESRPAKRGEQNHPPHTKEETTSWVLGQEWRRKERKRRRSEVPCGTASRPNQPKTTRFLFLIVNTHLPFSLERDPVGILHLWSLESR